MAAIPQPPSLSALKWLLALGLVAVIGGVDYWTGPEMGWSIFHLLPIFLVTWFLGWQEGLAIALLAAVVWFLVDWTEAGRYSQPWLPFWNAGIRLVFFVVFVALLSRLKKEKNLARLDFLTGVANRLALEEATAQEIERSRRYRHPLTMVLFDCDDFKRLNDLLGHHAGDIFLQFFARSLIRHFRKNDVVARLGGDEFALLLPEIAPDQVEAALAKLQQFWGKRWQKQKRGFACTFSAGAVTFLVPPKDLGEMLKLADHCLYAAKAKGKNQTCHRVMAVEMETMERASPPGDQPAHLLKQAGNGRDGY